MIDAISSDVMSGPDGAARALLRPTPTPHYPVPWRLAEVDDGHVVVVCADGHYCCLAATVESGRIIVAAVNAWAEQ